VSNAWHYYLGPLAIASVFMLAGAVSLGSFLWGSRDADGRRKVGPIAIVCFVFTFGVGGWLLSFILPSPTPWERQKIFDHVYRTPPERIERFVIKAGTKDQATPLTPVDVVIDDPVRIRKIAEILRTATEVWPNHPRTRWYAIVEMVTLDGTYYFSISATEPGGRNGTLVGAWASEKGKWNLGDVRADGLEEIIEDAVKKKP
jgi:hypothetical protein